MSAESQDAGGSDPALMGRRDALKLAAGAGAATVGLSGKGLPPAVKPVQDTEALAPLVAAGLLLATGATAGFAVGSWTVNGDTSLDPDKVLEDEVYTAANAVAQGRSAFTAEMDAKYSVGAEQTPFGNSAWSTVRSVTIRELENGASESEAQSAAQEALDKQATIAYTNVVEKWNTGASALFAHINAQDDNNQEILSCPAVLDPGDLVSKDISPDGMENFGSGAAYGYNAWNLPKDPKNVDELDYTADTPFVAYHLHVIDQKTAVGPLGSIHTADDSFPAEEQSSNTTWWARDDKVEALHSDMETITVLNGANYSKALAKINSAYDSISGSLSTYVTEMYQSVNQGTIDGADAITPFDISERFADASPQERLAAELLAAGADVPNEVGYQAKISHPDLQSDSLWGWVYPQYADGVDMTLSPGTTIPSADYKMAYFGYISEVDGDMETIVLSGNSDLQILDLTGVPGEEDMPVEDGVTAGTNGRVTVWEGAEENAPDPIRYPADHAGWVVQVVGASTDDAIKVGNLMTQDTSNGIEYYADSTALADGELIEHMAIVPSVDYSRPVDYVADPTTVNESELVQRIETINDRIEKIDEMDDSSGGGGGDWTPDINWPSVGPIDTAGEWILATGGAIVGSIVLGNLTN